MNRNTIRRGLQSLVLGGWVAATAVESQAQEAWVVGKDGQSWETPAEVMAGVAEEGDNGGDSLGTGPANSVHHDEELHQVLVGGRAGGLDEKDILPTDVFIDPHVGFTIRKTSDFGVGQAGSDLVGDPLGKSGVGVPGKKFHGR